ncbi:MAG TPA: EAL domain-containing protein [Nocardioidaceae bacterium]|nr:EAL domain-containing protein [Nocardioidaceae bacterium]
MRPSLASRAFDSGIGLLGVLIALWSIAMLIGDPSMITPVFFLGIPLIAFMGWFPMLIGRGRGGIEIGLDTCVLVFLATVSRPAEALAVWSLGNIVCQVFTDKRPITKVFNIGIGITAAALAVVSIELTRGTGTHGSPRELFALGLGAAVYFLCDFSISAISLNLEEDSSLFKDVAPTGALGAFAAFLAIASLGYLGALVYWTLPSWTAILLAVPISTILVASRAQSRGAEHARRLKVLLDTAVDVQTAEDRETLLEVLRTGASDLLRDSRVALRAARPGEHEVGVRVQGPSEELWLVGPARNRARSTAKDDQQGLTALVAVAEDGFARLSLSDAMAHQAWHDPLTGLANRSLFMDRVAGALDVQKRRSGRLAVLFCDLDGFKRVNDLFGHAAGDDVLVKVGARIRAAVRSEDTVARLGGDEFAVLLEKIEDAGEVTAACNRILAALRGSFSVSGEDVSVTTTIGVAMSEAGSSADALLSQADLAMYHAKSHGKNRFETYRLSFGDERLQRIELVETLRRAVEEKDLSVVYQPVVDLRTSQILGVEALVRWKRDGVAVAPDLFIPTAEESGLIVGVGEIVLDIVTKDAPRLLEAAGRTLSVGVNVSAQQLQLDNFVSRVLTARAAMGAVHLILEVTERDFVHNDPRTVDAMTTLAKADVRFAIDDFGVGFSSMNYLRRLPVRILKVDRSFLGNIEEDPKACTLVRSMVVLGDALGLDVIVEGIEGIGQLSHVMDHCGAAFGQGFLFAEPMTCDELAALLQEKSIIVPDPEIFASSRPTAIASP